MEPGRNVLASLGGNYAGHAPLARSAWTGFVLQGDGPPEAALVDTGPSWRAVRNHGYDVIPFGRAQLKEFYVAGPGDRVDGARYPWGWQDPGFDDGVWPSAVPVGPAAANGSNITDTRDAGAAHPNETEAGALQPCAGQGAAPRKVAGTAAHWHPCEQREVC